MYRLPTHMVPVADQTMARVDHLTDHAIEAVRVDLTAGHDVAALWWTYANSFSQCPAEEIGPRFASTLLRLARQTPKPPKDNAEMSQPEQYALVIPSGTHFIDACHKIVQMLPPVEGLTPFLVYSSADRRPDPRHTTPQLRYGKGSDWAKDAQELAQAYGASLIPDGPRFHLNVRNLSEPEKAAEWGQSKSTEEFAAHLTATLDATALEAVVNRLIDVRLTAVVNAIANHQR